MEAVPGSGKSVFIKSLLTSIINNINCDIFLIDLKIVELANFRNCKQVKKYVYETPQAVELIADLLEECKRRYNLFFKYGVTNLKDYNKVTGSKMKYQFIFIEEFVAFNDKVGMKLLRELVSLSRASGQFLILSCQRADNTVIDNVLKANLDNRISFRTSDSKNSKIILDEEGAERITVPGRFIFKSNSDMQLVQGYNITDPQIKEIIKPYLKVNKINSKPPQNTKSINKTEPLKKPDNTPNIKLNKL